MNYRTYEDFDLLFERIPTNSHEVYYARLLNSPTGQSRVRFGHYCYPQQWEALKTSTDRPSFSQPSLTNRPTTPFVTMPLTAQEWGQLLFENVFHSDLLHRWITSLSYVRQNNSGLRILLRLNDVPELAIFPWEYLYSSESGGFLALSDETPIVRYLDLPKGTNTAPTVEHMRMLVVVSQPHDFLAQLDVSQELDDLQYVLEDSRAHVPIELEVLEPGTLEGLQQRLQEKPIHILHFIGHGQYDAGQGKSLLFFETVDRRPAPVTAERLTHVLRNHESLRLIFLNSCEGATGGTNNIFSGLAQQLVKSMPATLMAVIAMQTNITDQTAISLTRNFYQAIASGYPVDSALTIARNAVFVTGNSNYDWGTPALFMRARDGKLFDIPKSVQHPGFQVLNPEDLESNASKIENKVSRKFLNLLYENRLLVLSEEPQITLQTIAYHLAYELNKAYPSLSIWEWQKDPEQLDFRYLFPLYEKVSRAPNDAIFIIPGVSNDLFTEHFLTDLAPLLVDRQQYLLLITAASRNILDLNKTSTRFWAEPAKTIYKAKHLLTELEQRLKKNEQRLPEHLLDRLQERQSDLGYSLSRIATQLRLPVHMDTFVERLCNQDEHITKEHIKELIQISKAERDEDRIRYMYHHLSQRRDQLLVVGLCLLGGVTETQFFQLLEQIIKSCWQYAFTEVEILDYYHLHNLQIFFKYDTQEQKQYPVERAILPQYTNQWWHLLLIIWESHRNHLRKTFAELAAITIDSISEQRDEYGNEQQRQRLRNTIGTVFSNVGRISLPSIEDTLLDLASHQRSSTQAVVADAIARWYDKNEKVDARNQLFSLLQRWLCRNWSQESNWKSNPRDQRYVRFTIARTVNQVLDKVTDPLPAPLPDLLLGLLDGDEKVEKFFNTNISRKIFPSCTPHLIECWQKLWEESSKDEVTDNWLQAIYVIAPHCKRHNQLQIIAELLVDVLSHGIKKHDEAVTNLLRARRYLVKEVFPAHIVKLNEDGTLLYLAHLGNFEGDILDVLLEVYQNHPQYMQTMIEQWRLQWSSYLQQIREFDEDGWYNVLTLLGKFYDDIDQFDYFPAWLPHMIEQDDIKTQSQLVEVFHRIDSYQSAKRESTQFDELDPNVSSTGIQSIVYAWLINEQKGAAFHLIVFWFSAKLLGEIDRRSMRRNVKVSFYLKKLVPFLVSLFQHRYRMIIGNLLPVIDGLFQDKPEEIQRILKSWQKNSNHHLQQVADRLQWSLRLCQLGRTIRSLFSKTRKSK